MTASAQPTAQPSAVAAPNALDGGRFAWHAYGAGAAGRRYKLYVPASLDARRPAPLVVLLHGCTQDPDDLARGSRMNEAAERGGVLVAYPEQPATANGMKCWRWFEGAQQRRDGEEVSIVAGITREVMRAHRVDPRRVHVAGISAGAALALLAAATHPELYASAASHSGVPLGVARSTEEAWALMRAGAPDGTSLRDDYLAVAGEPTRVVPLLVVHGAADQVVSVRNARQLAAQWMGTHGLVPATTDPTRAIEMGGRMVEVTRYVRCDGDPEPLGELLVIAELGHAWSGGSRAGTFADETGPAASEMMLDFFARHPMPGAQREHR